MRHDTAVLIACKNGRATIANAVRSASAQADVFVVSDGSTDGTSAAAIEAGAALLWREDGGGKPNALRQGTSIFHLASKYRYIAVLDDDTTLDPDYVEKVTAKLDADENVAAASGRICSVWDHKRRWNPFIAMRAFMYWSYQSGVKRGQDALRLVNVICGANTIFRAEIFQQLIDDDAPYAIDDMYWLAEIVRRKLGRVAYVHDAHSYTIDPHTLKDWYRQTVRWSWGQFQSIRGHRLGFRLSWFDVGYLGLLLDWIPYMLEPFAIVPLAYFLRSWIDPLWFGVFYLATWGVWVVVASLALKKWRLVLLAPALLALDLVYRVTMLHAFVKAIVRPTIDTCKWESPARFQLETAAPGLVTDPRRAS